MHDRSNLHTKAPPIGSAIETVEMRLFLCATVLSAPSLVRAFRADLESVAVENNFQYCTFNGLNINQ